MATHYNITGYQGDYIYLILTGKDDSNNIISLSGYDVRGQVRASYGSTGVLLDLNPSILGNATGGAMIISIDSNISKYIPVSDHIYDIERYPIGVTSGNSIKLMQGKFTILPEITR
jgi:hypothetical protein